MTALCCGECGAPMVARTSKYGPFYGCSAWPRCRGTHGAHPDGSPLGVPADAATKAARIRAHAAFDRLWKGGTMKRAQAYGWLSRTLGIAGADCHIGRFDAATCERVVAAVEARVTGNTTDAPAGAERSEGG